MEKKNVTFIVITVTLLLLWGRTYIGHVYKNEYVGLLFLFLTILFTVCVTWLLYRKEWINILGLKSKNITKKIIWRAFGIGILCNVLCTILLLAAYRLMLKEIPQSPFEGIDELHLLFLALIVAPLTEELLFRGFMQGLWQRLYSEKEKLPIWTIITITSLFFAISHFGFLYRISLKQFILTGISVFISALYFGWLRYKYQSIVPSIFAHLGFNLGNWVKMLLIVIYFLIAKEVPFSTIKDHIIKKTEYINDTTAYNLDSNNMDEWQKSFTKLTAFEGESFPELIKCLKGKVVSIPVYFTIDTCEYVVF